MVHAHELDRETAEAELISRHNGMQALRGDTALLEPSLEDAECQRRAVNRHVNLAQYIGQGANVILVAMRQYDALDTLAVLQKVRDIRNDKIDAEHVLRREHEPRIDDENIVAKAQHRHVLPNLAKAAQGDNL